MNILVKLLSTIIIITIVSQTAFAKQLEGEALRANVIKRLPKLNHTKLQALMQRVGKKPPKNFYNCLCRKDGGGAAMGVSVSYHPEPLKPYDEKYDCQHSGPPCMAQGYGCWRFPLPNDQNMTNFCIEHAIYDDNSTIVDAIVGTIEGLSEERLPKVAEIGLQSLLKDLFEKSCLPVPENINNLNPHKMILPEDILNKNHLSNMTQVNSLSEIYSNIMKTDNICEASIESKLLIDATQGKGMLGTAGSLVWIVKGKDEFDLFKGYASYTSNKVTGSKAMGKVLSGAHSFIKIADYYNKYRNIVKVYQNNINNYQKNADIMDALAVYRKSKNWDLNKINRVIKRLDKSLPNLNNAIDSIEKRRQKEVRIIDEEEKALGKALLNQVKENPNMAPPMHYNNPFALLQLKRRKINKEADRAIEIRLLTITSNQIKNQILREYRKPLIEKSCNEYIDNRLKNCPANIGRDKPLTHKDINKLWDETKMKIKKWNKTQEKIQEWKENKDAENIIKIKK
jgi:hypothetical protein